MKANISGYEAIEEGLNAGGIERFLCDVVREPLYNAEKAVCRGSFFASDHQRSACIISEKDMGALGYLTEKRDSLNAGFEVIVLGKSLSGRLLGMMRDFSIPVMAAETVEDIRDMTADGLIYSEISRSPTVVFIPVRLLRSRQPVDLDGRFFCDDIWNVDLRERNGRKDRLESKYNRLYESTADTKNRSTVARTSARDACKKYLIIAMSGCTGIIREAVGSIAGVSILDLDLFSAGALERIGDIWNKADKTIVIGSGSDYVRRVLDLIRPMKIGSMSFEPSADDLNGIKEICGVLRDSIYPVTAEDRRSSVIFEDEDRIIKPPERPVTDDMCEDCIYRAQISSIMEHSGHTRIYEDIYCEKRGTMVRSGIHSAASAYSGTIVITNRKGNTRAGLNVRYISAECERCRQ